MPISPFDNPYIKPPTSIQPAGGSGSCSDSGGGFSPPQCPITTTRTVCTPEVLPTCSCVNNGYKGPWAVICYGCSGNSDCCGDGYCQNCHENNYICIPDCEYSRPCNQNSFQTEEEAYEYFIAECSGRGGLGPAPAPPAPDLSGIDNSADCSTAAAANFSYDISWECSGGEESKCTDVTDTTYVDATAVAGISLTAFLTGFKNNQNMIDVTKLNPTDKANFLEALIKNGAYPSTIDIIDFDKTTFDPVTGKMTPAFKPPSDPSLSRMSKTTYDTYLNNMKTIKQTFDKTIIDGKLKLNPLSPVGKLFDELRKNGGRLAKTVSPCLRKIPAIAAFIGAASWDAFAYALDDAGLGDSDISWTCDPGPDGGGGPGGPGGGPGGPGGPETGSDNDGQLNYSDGVFLPDGSFMKHDGSRIPKAGVPDSSTPSRSNFIQGNLSTTVNMAQMINTSIPSSIKNNLTLNANFGVPMTNFPILKISKETPTPRDIIVIDDGKFIPGQVNYPY